MVWSCGLHWGNATTTAVGLHCTRCLGQVHHESAYSSSSSDAAHTSCHASMHSPAQKRQADPRFRCGLGRQRGMCCTTNIQRSALAWWPGVIADGKGDCEIAKKHRRFQVKVILIWHMVNCSALPLHGPVAAMALPGAQVSSQLLLTRGAHVHFASKGMSSGAFKFLPHAWTLHICTTQQAQQAPVTALCFCFKRMSDTLQLSTVGNCRFLSSCRWEKSNCAEG